MFIYNKKLQYPVKIARPNPRLASVIISQYGGPDGELGASLRYLSQRYSMPFDEQKALLTDIGTEGSNFSLSNELSLRGSAATVAIPKGFLPPSYEVCPKIRGIATPLKRAGSQ